MAGSVVAKAATITEMYDFTATFSSSTSVNPWMGSFTITFDPTASGSLGPLPLDAFSSNLPASYNPFEYSQAASNIAVGDNCGSGAFCGASTGQAWLLFTVDAAGNPTPLSAALDGYASQTFDISIATTPIPEALPLFATGLGFLGLLGWRRKKKAAALAA